jgi:hypothetical protein
MFNPARIHSSCARVDTIPTPIPPTRKWTKEHLIYFKFHYANFHFENWRKLLCPEAPLTQLASDLGETPLSLDDFLAQGIARREWERRMRNIYGEERKGKESKGGRTIICYSSTSLSFAVSRAPIWGCHCSFKHFQQNRGME